HFWSCPTVVSKEVLSSKVIFIIAPTWPCPLIDLSDSVILSTLGSTDVAWALFQVPIRVSSLVATETPVGFQLEKVQLYTFVTFPSLSFSVSVKLFGLTGL